MKMRGSTPTALLMDKLMTAVSTTVALLPSLGTATFGVTSAGHSFSGVCGVAVDGANNSADTLLVQPPSLPN